MEIYTTETYWPEIEILGERLIPNRLRAIQNTPFLNFSGVVRMNLTMLQKFAASWRPS